MTEHNGRILQPLCGAKTRSGEPCQKHAIIGSKRCKFHGGKSLKGIAHPNWQGGKDVNRLVDVLPRRLQQVGELALRDDELVSLRSDIVVAEARMIDLLNRVESGEAGELWEKLLELWEEYERTPPQQRQERAKLEHQIGQTLQAGRLDYLSWEEVRVESDHKRKLIESERKRLQELKAAIPADKALTALSAILNVVAEVVNDESMFGHPQEQLGEISRRAYHIMNYG